MRERGPCFLREVGVLLNIPQPRFLFLVHIWQLTFTKHRAGKCTVQGAGAAAQRADAMILNQKIISACRYLPWVRISDIPNPVVVATVWSLVGRYDGRRDSSRGLLSTLNYEGTYV